MRSRRMLLPLLAAGLWCCVVVPAQVTSPPKPQAVQVPQTYQRTSPAQLSGGLEQAELITASAGWARSDKQLMFSNDQGVTWKEITPPSGGQDLKIGKVLFTSPVQGWVLQQKQDTDQGTWILKLSTTSDQGSTWQDMPVPTLTEQEQHRYYGGAELHFLNAEHGWMALKNATGSAFCDASLYETTNGGQSWQKISGAPVCDLPVFANEETWYAPLLPTGNTVFKTSNGGRTWISLKLPDPPLAKTTLVLSDLQVQGQQITLVRTLSNLGTRLRVDTISSTDGGMHWSVSGNTTALPANALEKTMSAREKTTVQAYWDPSGSFIVGVGQSRSVAVVPPSWAGTKFGVRGLSFPNVNVGWLTITGTQCDATGCTRGHHLFRTADGGKSLQEAVIPFAITRTPVVPLDVRTKKPVPSSTSYGGQNSVQPGIRSGPGGTFAVIVNGEGVDVSGNLPPEEVRLWPVLSLGLTSV